MMKNKYHLSPQICSNDTWSWILSMNLLRQNKKKTELFSTLIAAEFVWVHLITKHIPCSYIISNIYSAILICVCVAATVCHVIPAAFVHILRVKLCCALMGFFFDAAPAGNTSQFVVSLCRLEPWLAGRVSWWGWPVHGADGASHYPLPLQPCGNWANDTAPLFHCPGITQDVFMGNFPVAFHGLWSSAVMACLVSGHSQCWVRVQEELLLYPPSVEGRGGASLGSQSMLTC